MIWRDLGLEGSFTQPRPNADSVLEVRLKVVSQITNANGGVLSLSLNFPLFPHCPTYFLIASLSQFSTDNRDTGGEWIELGDDENTTSSGRSSSDWNDWGWKYVRTPADVDSQLQGTLQRRLTRVLTRKVNRNVRSSCLVGSESTVTVNLTAVGNHRPWVATCPQEIPADRETGGMGIDRDQP